MKQITIDFDSTLTDKEVQVFVRELQSKGGVEIFILTSRFDNLHKHQYPINPTNEEVFELAKELNIPDRNIFFTNMRDKWQFLSMTNVVAHLDDDSVEIEMINGSKYCKTKGIHFSSNWREQLNEAIK